MLKPLIIQIGYQLVPTTSRPRWLRKQFEKSGSTYIKVGQFISSRSDIFGKELSQEMMKLQDSVENVAEWDDVTRFVDRSKFETIDEKPFASASVAQIHRATLKQNGTQVVLKVKKPTVDTRMRSDIQGIKNMMGFLSFFPFLESKRVEPWIQEIDNAINKELDFRNEIENLKTFYEMYKYDESIIIPRVYPDLSNDNVIVMEYVPSSGKYFDSTKVINTFIEQIIFEGVIHGDLHGGNIGFKDPKTMILYDFGNTIRISPQYRGAMRKFITALQMKNVKRTMNAMSDMGMIIRDEKGTRLFIKKFFKYLDTLDISSFTFDPDEIIDKVPVQIDKTTFTIIRSYSLLEGLCKMKDPTFRYDDIFMTNLELLYLDQF